MLVEAFVDPTRFNGACYKASNWIEVGHTAGRRDGVQKIVFVHTLCKQWRDILSEKPAVRLGEQPRTETPIEQKESMKWLRSFRKVAEIQRLCPETMLVSIGDREADIYELFLEETKGPCVPKLMVRAEKSCARKVEQEHLWQFMSSACLEVWDT